MLWHVFLMFQLTPHLSWSSSMSSTCDSPIVLLSLCSASSCMRFLTNILLFSSFLDDYLSFLDDVDLHLYFFACLLLFLTLFSYFCFCHPFWRPTSFFKYSPWNSFSSMLSFILVFSSSFSPFSARHDWHSRNVLSLSFASLPASKPTCLLLSCCLASSL